MHISPPISKPALPQVRPGQKSVQVNYVAPKTEERVIGHIPQDHYSRDTLSSTLLSAVQVLNPTSAVYRDQPVMGADGKPVFENRSKEVDLTPYSKLNWGLLGGGLGGALAGVAGLGVALAATVAAAPVAIPAAAVGAAVGAYMGAKSVDGDTVTLDFREKDVVRHQLDGYSQNSWEDSSRDKNGNKTIHGYHITYSEDVSEHKVGEQTYWEPYARHSSDHKNEPKPVKHVWGRG